MGMLYRRKETDSATGLAKRTGRWLIKYYDDGKPYYQSTGTYDKAEAKKVLEKVLGRVAEGRRETPVNRVRFDDLIADLKTEYAMKGRKTWERREQHLAHLKPPYRPGRTAEVRPSLFDRV